MALWGIMGREIHPFVYYIMSIHTAGTACRPPPLVVVLSERLLLHMTGRWRLDIVPQYETTSMIESLLSCIHNYDMIGKYEVFSTAGTTRGIYLSRRCCWSCLRTRSLRSHHQRSGDFVRYCRCYGTYGPRDVLSPVTVERRTGGVYFEPATWMGERVVLTRSDGAKSDSRQWTTWYSTSSTVSTQLTSSATAVW